MADNRRVWLSSPFVHAVASVRADWLVEIGVPGEKGDDRTEDTVPGPNDGFLAKIKSDDIAVGEEGEQRLNSRDGFEGLQPFCRFRYEVCVDGLVGEERRPRSSSQIRAATSSTERVAASFSAS